MEVKLDARPSCEIRAKLKPVIDKYSAQSAPISSSGSTRDRQGPQVEPAKGYE